MATFEALIAELRAEGELDSEGVFTLDREKAREKMRHFRLADARAYVVELVQAAVASGATRIEVELDADDMHMRFDGRGFDREDLDQLYGAMFSRGESEVMAARRQLALGLNAAMALAPRHVQLTSGTQFMELRPDEPDRIETAQQAVAGAVIHVKDRFSGQTLIRFVRKLGGKLAEAVHLRDRCRHLRVELLLDGEAIGGEPELADALVRRSVSEPNLRATLGFRAAASEAGAWLQVLKYGVQVAELESAAFPPCFVAVLESDLLRKDIAQASIVRDANLARVLRRLKRAMWPALAELADHAQDSSTAAGVFRLALLHRSTAGEMRRVLAAARLGRGTDPSLHRIAAVPLWPSATHPAPDGAPSVSLGDVIAASVQRRRAEYAPQFMGNAFEWDADRPVPLIAQIDERDYVARVLGATSDVSAEIQTSLARRRNVARWRARKMKPEIPLALTEKIAKVELDSELVKGEVGLSLWPETQSGLWLIKDGCLLERRTPDAAFPGLVMALEADFAPSARHDHVQCDKLFMQIVLEVARSIPRVLAAPLLHYDRTSLRTDEQIATVRRLLGCWLTLDLGGGALEQWLAIFRVRDARTLDHARKLLEEHPVAVLPSLPELLASDAPAYARLALFPTLAGGRITLAAIAHAVAEHGAASYVHSRLAAGTRATTRPVLLADDDDLATLQRVFGAGKLQDFSAEYAQAEGEGRHFARPRVDLQLDGVGVAHRRFQIAGIGGQLYLLEPDPPQVQVFARVRLLRDHRPLDHLRFAVPIGAIVAVVNHDGVTPNADWTAAVENAELQNVRELVVTQAAQLLTELCAKAAALSGAERALLLNACARVCGGRVREPWLDALAQALEPCPLFRDASGRRVSLEQIRAERRRAGAVLYVPVARVVPSDAGRMILVLDAEQRAALAAVLGDDALSDGEPWLQERAQSLRIRGAPQLQSVTLADRDALVRVALQTDTVHGEVGLWRLVEAPGLELRLCCDRRQHVVLNTEASLSLVAILNDDTLPLTETGLVAMQSPRLADLAALARAAVPALIERLLDDPRLWSGGQRHAALTHLVDYLVAEAARTDARPAGAEAAYQRARGYPAFAGVGGHYSFDQLQAAYDLFAEQAYLLSELPGEPLDARRIVLIAGPNEVALLRRLFPSLRAYALEWLRQQKLRVLLAAAPPLPRRPEGALEARGGAIRGGLIADLWLPADAEPDLHCEFGRFGRTVARRSISDLFACSGRVEGEELALSEDGTALTLAEAQRTSLERLAFRLYQQLAKDLFRPSSGRALRGDRADAARRLLQRAASSFAALPDRSAVDADYRAFFEELGRPPFVDAEPIPGAESAPADRAAREAGLVSALRTALGWAADQHASLLDALNLDRITVNVLAVEMIAECRAHGVAINRRHPLVQALLAAQAFEPVLLAFLASSTYTAMNYFWNEIEDDHEREFHRVLLDQLLDAL